MGNWKGKLDEAADAIRWLSGRKPDGIPLDVSDDVLNAAKRATYIRPGDGREVEMDPNGWPAGTEGWAASPSQFDGLEAGPLTPEPDFELGSPLWHQLDKGMRSYDNLRRNRTPNLRNQNPELARIAGAEIRAKDAEDARIRSSNAARAQGMREGSQELALAAAATGVPFLLSQGIDTPGLTSTGGAEDLVEETRPAPKVMAPEEEVPSTPDYSYEARRLMEKLNAMRRAAGGEVPESRAMMAEINRLLGLANTERNAAGYEPEMPADYHGEAQRLLQDLNARRMEAGGEVPDTMEVMAKVRRLQALGDQMRNAG